MNVNSLTRRLAAIVLGLACGAVAQEMTAENGRVATNVDLPRYPAVSPDGKTISFTWHGDLFTAPAAGGAATRLTTSPFDDLYSAFSPDGRRLAFTSARNGPGNLFTLAIDGTDLRQVTFVDRPLALTQWGRDEQGRERIFAGAVLDILPFNVAQQWEFSPDGGDPARVSPAEGSAPCASPDGRKVLITRGVSAWARRGYRGSQNRDVWVYDRVAKTFARVTAYDGNDGKAKWANGETILFISDRVDNTYNLFSIKAGAAEDTAVQLTNFKGEGVDDFDVAPGTGTVVFSRWDKLYRLQLGQAQPAEITLRANEDVSDRVRFQPVAGTVTESALSPDGKTLAMISYGELYVRGVDAKSPTRRVTATLDGRKRDVAWSADGQRLLFVCDAAGTEEIYEATVKLTRSEVRRKAAGATSRPATPADDSPAANPTAAGHVGATFSPATQPGVMTPVTPEEDADQAAGRRVSLPVVSPGGGVAAPAAAAGELSRWGDALAFTTKRLFAAVRSDRSPTPSPDGRTLAFQRAGAVSGYELVLRDEATGRESVLVKNADNFDFRWSPDSRYVAYATEDRNNNADIFLVPADGSEKPVNLTRHPNSDTSPRFSADGKVLAFLSNRTGVGDEMAAYTVYLDKRLEDLATPELDAYYRDAAAAARRRTPPATRPTNAASTQSATRPATQATTAIATTGPSTRRRGVATTMPLPLKRIDLEDAYLRIRRLTNVRGSISDLELAPAGDRIYFNGYLGPTRSLLTQTRDAAEPTRVANSVSVQGLSLAGDTMAVVDSGPTRTPGAAEAPARVAGSRAGLLKLPAGEIEYYDPADRLQIDLKKQAEQKFLEAARVMGNLFYDPKMNGVDWKANTALYLPLAAAAHTADEFDFVANRFIGELNASHLGVNAPTEASPLTQRVGRLGIKTRRGTATTRPTSQPSSDELEVTDVTPDGPADRGDMALKPGDRLTAIDFRPIAPDDTLDKLLLGKAGTEIVASVRRGNQSLDLLLTPTSAEVLSALAYNQWRQETARKVDQLSGGRLGYIHIQGMNQASLETYKRDLFAACDGKDGLIIDVRWNGGGSTADLLLASIMSAYHAYTVPRGAETLKDSYPTDRLFIPRYVGPINMLCNERSFSNAEITAHAFKTLKRGTLVGNTTAGGVISTGSATLLDGTTVRVPGRGWFTPDGTNMELNGAKPDLMLVQTPEDEVTNADRQLKAAVDDLMKRLK